MALGWRCLILGASCPLSWRKSPRPTATSSPRRWVQKEFESEHQVRVGGLLRPAGSASSPLGRPPAARTPLLAVWKCLLSWFSQIQHKRGLLPVRGAAATCPAPSAPCSVLKGLRHHLPGRAQATPACGSLSCSRLPAGLAMAIWGGCLRPCWFTQSSQCRAQFKRVSLGGESPPSFHTPSTEPACLVAHGPRGTPPGAAFLPPLEKFKRAFETSPRSIYPNN